MSRRHPEAEPRVCFDLDGTLTVGPWPALAPDVGMIRLARALQEAGVEVAVFTGRDEEDRPHVERFLKKHGLDVPWLMFQKPRADLYVDDMGLIQSPRLLEAFYRHVSADDWKQQLVSGQLGGPYQDEVSGTVENPDRPTASGSRPEVVIPFTSGMDSLVLWQAARDERLNYELVYFDMGQEYAALEIEQARKVTLAFGDTVTVVTMPLAFEQHEHILLGRNAVVIFTAAERVGTWGEVHFGVLGGESPESGGDKSHRFLADTQALLTMLGRDVRLCTPLAALDKPDLVAWLDRRDLVPLLLDSKTCFDPAVLQCGTCVPCFRKWSALLANEIDPAPFFPDGYNFGSVAGRYRKRLDSGDGGYTDTRRADLEHALSVWSAIVGR